MTDQESIAQQQELLATHRRVLATWMLQRATFGPYVPPYILESIRNDRAEIQRIKQVLRSWGCVVEDLPDEEVIETDSQAASRGLEALHELMPDPEVHAIVAAFHADIQAIREQTHIMSAYKELHDRFQELESCYNTIHYFIYREGQLLASEQLSWESLVYSISDLQGFIEALLHCAVRHKFNELGSWPQILSRASRELQAAVDQIDSVQLKRATNAIRSVIDRQLSRVNDRLIAAASMLRRDAPMQKLLILLENLTRLPLDTASRWRLESFEQGTAALMRLGHRLVRSIDDHNDFQEIDNHLRRVEAVFERDMSELLYAWEDLRSIAWRLCSNNPDAWAVRLNGLTGELERALERQSPVEIMRSFRKYRSQAGHGFNQVDRNLLGLCMELKEIGESLTVILKATETGSLHI
jgi:hypothetical protein